MSTNPSPNGKGGGKASNGVSNDADSIMPLLFATIGNPAISFKKMAAMDEHGRTESALEHKFRKWRQKGRDIAAANPEHAGPAAASPTKKPRAPPKKAANSKTKESSEQADVGDEEDEVDDAEEGLGVRQEHDAMAGSDTEMAPINTKGKPKATRATKGADGKKRTASEKSGDTENGDGEAPAKKVKLEKKGTAKVVKKSNVEIPSASEGENGENGEGKKKVAAKAKAKPKAKPATKGKAAEQGKIAIHDDEDLDDGANGEEQAEMGFDLA